jgi:Fic family protein
LQRQPIATAGALAGATRLTPATINKSLAHLEKLGIVGRLNERRRGRVFCYRRYVALLNAELETPR